MNLLLLTALIWLIVGLKAWLTEGEINPENVVTEP